MTLIANLLNAFAGLLDVILSLFVFLFIARAVLSWVSPDPTNMLVQLIHGTTEPILRPIRRRIPPLGMLDLSVLIAILACYFFRAFLVQSMYDYAIILKH